MLQLKIKISANLVIVTYNKQFNKKRVADLIYFIEMFRILEILLKV